MARSRAAAAGDSRAAAGLPAADTVDLDIAGLRIRLFFKQRIYTDPLFLKPDLTFIVIKKIMCSLPKHENVAVLYFFQCAKIECISLWFLSLQTILRRKK